MNPKGSRRESNTSPRRMEAFKRQVEAIERRCRGESYAQIAEALGYKNPASVCKAIMAGMKRSYIEAGIEDLRKLECQRLDELQCALWPQAKEGNPAAIDRVLRIMERRARLMGLDMPVRQEVVGRDGQALVINIVRDEKRDQAPSDSA